MKYPTFDGTRCPTDETLDYIETYNMVPGEEIKDWRPLFKFVVEAFDDKYGKIVYDDHSIDLSTGGWSNNETVISALHANSLFMAVFWQASRRGGHYTFSLPEGMVWE